MNTNLLLTLAALFLLPIFPFSIATNFFLAKLKGKTLLVTLLVMFFIGTFLLSMSDNQIVVKYISIFALLGSILYAFRMLSVSTAYSYLIFYYTVLSGFVWFWKFIEGDMLHFTIVMTLPLCVFGLLIAFLDSQYGCVHYKMFRGLGKHLPRFSILLILTIPFLIMTPYISGFDVFIVNISKFNIYYLCGILLIWILMTWSGVRLIEKFIYGKATRNLRYKDVSVLQSVFLIALLLASFILNFLLLEVA
jgi:hypothetical protein